MVHPNIVKLCQVLIFKEVVPLLLTAAVLGPPHALLGYLQFSSKQELPNLLRNSTLSEI